ncbi:competence protein CoiA family protein [Sphingopyxis panaciterrae]
MRHVEQITSSGQGLFTCIGCEERLTFRNGAKMRAHFAHKSGSKCSGETALHKYAKLIVAVFKRITLPQLCVEFDGSRDLVFPSKEVLLDSVELELPEADFQPDAMVMVRGERRAIEFKVFHAVDDAKREKVARADCPMVEVDLLRIPWRKLGLEELDRQILHDAPRTWIHHPVQAAARVRLEGRVAAERKKKAGQLRWHILERPQNPKIDREWVEDVKADLTSAKLEGFVGRLTGFGHWFTVPPILWQAALLHAHLFKPSVQFTPGSPLKLSGKWDSRHLSSCIPGWMVRNDLKPYPKDKLEAAGLTSQIYASAEWAAIDYLWGLTKDEKLFRFVKAEETFYVAEDVHRRIHNRHDLESAVVRILDGAFTPDADAFARRWMRRYEAEGSTPWAIAGEGGETFTLLRERISALSRMTHTYLDHPIVHDLCGLPIEKWRDDLKQSREERDRKAQEKLAVAKAGRRKKFMEAATQALKDEALAWLDSKFVEGVPILEWASESDDRYWKGFEQIDRAETAKKQRVVAAALVEDLRKRLTSASNAAFRDPARSRLFLHSTHPKIGGRRPIDACETEGNLRLVLGLLPKP